MRGKVLLASIAGLIVAGASYYAFNAWQTPRYNHQRDNGEEGGDNELMEYRFANYYNHVVRANVFTGQIEKDDILALRHAQAQHQNSTTKSNDIQWTNMGPINVGGRTRAILFLNGDPNNIIIGSVSGGLFKSTDQGENWSRVTGFDSKMPVSTIAQLGNGTIYVGTGNDHEIGNTGTGGSSFIGGGLFKSTDNGVTWELVSNFQPSFSTTDEWSFIDKIVADPSNPDKLWIANSRGLFPYIDGDASLQAKPTGIPLSGSCEDVDISSDGQVMLASVNHRLYQSTDGGQSFSASPNMPTSQVGRIESTIAPSDDNYMYASIANNSGYLLGIYATNDMGASWHVIAPSSNNGSAFFSPFGFTHVGQGTYDNVITVFPNNPRKIVLGGLVTYTYEMVGSVPGIQNFEELSYYGGLQNPILYPNYVHPDIHEFQWDSNGNLWIGCDGGVFMTNDGGQSFTPRNYGYITSQFYGIDANKLGQVLGGTQDNGTFFLNFEGITPQDALNALGGDGVNCATSNLNTDVLYGSNPQGVIYRSTDGGHSGDIPAAYLTRVGNAPGSASDFLTNMRLYENGNNQYSQLKAPTIFTTESYNFQPYNPAQVTDNQDTIVGYIPQGTVESYRSPSTGVTLSGTVPQDIMVYSSFNRGDTTVKLTSDTVMFKDYATSILAVGLPSGIYVTRYAISPLGSINWYRVAEGDGQVAKMVWSPDGDILYVGYTSGKVNRFSGFNSAYTEDQMDIDNGTNLMITKTTIKNEANAPVLGLDVDYSQGIGGMGQPAASPKLVIAMGGYGGSSKVMLAQDAVSSTGLVNFTNIWNVPSAFQGMPCYSVLMDKANSDRIMVGTEYGIWATSDGGSTWSSENGGDMPPVPVFDLRQDRLRSWQSQNTGMVYAGSHGAGIFKTGAYFDANSSGLEDHTPKTVSGLKVYPNPVVNSNYATLEFSMGRQADVDVQVYSITGEMVWQNSMKRMEVGNKNLKIDVSNLSNGTYIVKLNAGQVSQTGKFVVVR